MPTRAVTSKIMQAGHGKHWTRKEIEAREKAAAGVKRAAPKSITAPAWLSADAKRVWKRVLSSVRGLELLDNMDTEILAIYCDAYAQYTEMSKKKSRDVDDIKAMQAYSRIVLQYGDKLGLTPVSRARLVKKKSDELKDKFGEKFD